MRCLLEGHKPVQHPGVGEFKGQTFTICSVCGKSLENSPDSDQPALSQAGAYVGGRPVLKQRGSS